MAKKKAPTRVEKLKSLPQIVTWAKFVTKRIRTFFPARERGWNLADRSAGLPVLNQVVNAQVGLERALTPPAMPNYKPERGGEAAILYVIGPGWPADFYLAVKRILACHDALLEQCGWRARVVNGDPRGYRWDWTGKRGQADAPIPVKQLDALDKAGPQLDALDCAADHLKGLIDNLSAPPSSESRGEQALVGAAPPSRAGAPPKDDFVAGYALGV